MRLYVLLSLLFVYSMSRGAFGDDTSTGIQRLMSVEEYHEAGLDKLAPDEFEVLTRWLVRYRSQAQADLPEPELDATVGPAREAKTEEAIGLAAQAPIEGESVSDSPARKPGRQVLAKTRIAGAFTGWRGKTRFTLENGETWRQRTKGHYVYRAEYPEVEIYENRFGFPMLEVVATGRSIGVSRVE